MADLFTLFFGPNGWGLQMASGAWMTLVVSIAGLLIGSVIGALLAWGKLSHTVIGENCSNIYSALFRGLPELLVIYFVYFGSSSIITIIATKLGAEGFTDMPPYFAGALAVGVISGAYQGEVFRGAFLAISRGELEAAHSVGMGTWLRFRRIIFPQVMRFAIPGLGNLWQVALKDSSLISVTGVAEIMRVSGVGASATHQPLVFYLAGALLYLCITSLSNVIFDKAEAHSTRGMRRAGA